jgi:hypothetical protein
MKTVARAFLCAVLTVAFASTATAQNGKSAALAKELAAALDAASIDSIAAKEPSDDDTFIGALYFKGLQLLVVSAEYAAPLILDEKLGKKEYRDVYLDLNSASKPESKVFIEDLGADGLAAENENNMPFDAFDNAGKRVSFNGDFRQQQMSEDDYKKAFATADEKYTHMLTALLAQIKKSS